MTDMRAALLLVIPLLIAACNGGLSPSAELTPPSPQTSAAWPMQGANAARTGYTELWGPFSSGAGSELATDWTYYAAPINSVTYALCSPPVIDNLGNIYFATDIQIISLTASGVQRWAVHIDDIEAYGFLPTECGPVITEGDLVVFADGLGNAWAFDYDGNLVWELNDLDGSHAQLAADGDRLYIAHGSVLYAVSATGQAVWQLELPSPFHENTAPAIASDGTLLVRQGVDTFAAIDRAGELLWTYETELDWYEYWPYSVWANGLWLIPSSGGVAALTEDGELAWDYIMADAEELGLESAAPAVGADGAIYVPRVKHPFEGSVSQEQKPPFLVALDHDGQLAWEWTDHEAPYYADSGPVVVDGEGRIYLNSTRHVVILGAQGEELGRVGPLDINLSSEHLAISTEQTLILGYHREAVGGVN